MERLERLQTVQVTLHLMQEHLLCSSPRDSSSDRFVAEFCLFLIEGCNSPDEMRSRCDILIKQLPKVSMSFLKAMMGGKEPPSASKGLIQPRISGVENCSKSSGMGFAAISTKTSSFEKAAEDKKQAPGSQRIVQEGETQGQKSVSCAEAGKHLQDPKMTSLVGLAAMERANSTLEDFCRSYFMFHSMDISNPQHLFKHLPVLSFVEAYIYQLDEKNEEQLEPHGSIVEISRNAAGVGGCCSYKAAEEVSAASCNPREVNDQDAGHTEIGLGKDPFRELREILSNQGLLTQRIESELKDGVEYWRLERELCTSVANGGNIIKEDVFKAIRLKSFDYRVLNFLLYSLTGRVVNEVHVEFLAISELLVEIADDLFDYEHDVLKNSFNVLRMLVNACGSIAAPRILAKFIGDEEMRYQFLLEKLEPSLAKRYLERCAEAAKEGGGVSKHPYGSWTIPPIVVDERAFRAGAHV